MEKLPQKKSNSSGEPHLSELIKSTREKNNIALVTAEHDTKIRLRYLEAIEEGRYDLVPPSHSKGFVRKYGAYLGIPNEVINQELSLLSSALPKKQPFSPRPLTRETRLLVTPKVVMIAFSVIVLLGFIGYITYQVKQFAAPPLLEVTKPISESVVTTDSVAIEGKTDPGVTIYIDNSVAATGSDGIFSYVVTLRPGLNQITVRAENRIKKSASKIISVLYQAPLAPSPSPTPSIEPSAPVSSSTLTASPSPGAKITPTSSPHTATPPSEKPH